MDRKILAKGLWEQDSNGLFFSIVTSFPRSKPLFTNHPPYPYLPPCNQPTNQMAKLYGKGAGDPEWPVSGHCRRMKTEYSIVGDNLEVKESTNAGQYKLGRNKETIAQIVKTINELQAQRDEEAFDTYQEGLIRYLASIMRRVAGFYHGSPSLRLVRETLEDYESREKHGFKHNMEGRKEWNLWKERSKSAEDETTGECRLWNGEYGPFDPPLDI